MKRDSVACQFNFEVDLVVAVNIEGEAFSSAWLSHKYSMGVVTGVPRNAKTKAASSGRFELDPSSSRPTFLCCLFLFFRRFT